MGAAPGFVQQVDPRRTATPSGVYKPRRPQSSPLYRLIEDHFEEFSTVYDERFSRRWGYWRSVVADVVDKFLACAILKHGFARVRCGSCKEETLLADVPHRHVVLTVPKRLRPYFLYDRTLLGELSRVAARTVTSFIRATVGEKGLSVGIVSSIQTHGSLANWHPHLHLLVTDGGFRPDGTFVHLPLHDVATLTELARYCARNPIALGRMEYDEQQSAVTYHSDKPSGPTAGSETTDALEFLARLTSHIPNKGQVLQRYYGFYSSRQRGKRRKANSDAAVEPLTMVEPEPEALRKAKRRWAELLRHIFEVDPLACPRCGEEMRIVAFITEPKVIDRILEHLRRTKSSRRRPRAPPRRWKSPASTISA